MMPEGRWKEATVMIDDVTLIIGQVITLRVAMNLAIFDCGDDTHGRFMTAAYNRNRAEILEMLHKKGGT